MRFPIRSLAASLLVLLLGSASPALARGYKKGLDHRPRMAFDARDTAHLARVRDRIMAQEKPWSDAYADLRQLADTGRVVAHGAHGWRSQSDKWVHLYGQEVNNALVARARAAVVWLGSQGVDPTWLPLPKLPGQATSQGWLQREAAASAAVIDGMWTKVQGWKGFGVLNRMIVSSESLLVHAQAYDLLAGLPANLRPDLSKSAANLADFAEDHQRWGWTVDGQDGNHGLRVRAGLGAAAVAINKHDGYRWWKPWTWREDPADWVRCAERELDAERKGSDLRAQVGGGAYAEGTSYHAYAEAMYAPFFLAYVRFDGSRPLRRSPRLEAAERWSVAIRLPGGARPAVDNGSISSLLAGGFVTNRLGASSSSAAQRQLLGWDWRDQGAPGIRGARAYELLAAYDPSDADEQAIATYTPPQGSAFLADAGAAALRSGGYSTDAYALMLTERGDVRTYGAGHEDADPLALQVMAEGDLLVLDPGYGGWSEVKKTHAPEHHALVLVDGEGPDVPRKGLLGLGNWKAKDVDCHLESGPRTFDSPRVDSASARTGYEGVSIRRTASLVLGRFLVVEDEVGSSKAHDLTVNLPISAGGTKKGAATLTPVGATFVSHVRSVPVELGVGSTAGAPRLDLGRGHDALGGFSSGGDEHGIVKATVRAATTKLLTVLTWGPPGMAPARPVKLLEQPGAVALGSAWSTTTLVALTHEGTTTVVVPATATTPRVETDGGLVLVVHEGGGLKAVVAHDATRVKVDTMELTRTGRGTIRHEP